MSAPRKRAASTRHPEGEVVAMLVHALLDLAQAVVDVLRIVFAR